LQNFITGYLMAVHGSRVEDRGAVVYEGFPQWLDSRQGWEVSGHPIRVVQDQTASDGEAWTEFWRLLWECVDSQPAAAAATDSSQPDSKQGTEDEPRFDDELSPEESARMAGLPARDLDEIDAAILSIAHHRWQKVLFIVSQMGLKHREAPDGHLVPMGFYVRRIAALAAEGRLESTGDIRRMGYSEVRLPRRTKNTSGS
jgi:hypothetical protein